MEPEMKAAELHPRGRRELGEAEGMLRLEVIEAIVERRVPGGGLKCSELGLQVSFDVH
jgi:hypothetical protein